MARLILRPADITLALLSSRPSHYGRHIIHGQADIRQSKNYVGYAKHYLRQGKSLRRDALSVRSSAPMPRPGGDRLRYAITIVTSAGVICDVTHEVSLISTCIGSARDLLLFSLPTTGTDVSSTPPPSLFCAGDRQRSFLFRYHMA